MMQPPKEKMEILERLVKEGHITLAEAFLLSETEKEYISYPAVYPTTMDRIYIDPNKVITY